MTATAEDPVRRKGGPDLRTRLARLAAKPGFQRWAARIPGVRGHVRQEGAALFDLVQGFVASQVLRAVVELEILHHAMEGPLVASELSRRINVPLARTEILLQAAAALGLLDRKRDIFRITTRGAALTGVPGLEGMIRHHDAFYRDMSDPVALLRGEVDTELARFWPYVFGGAGGDAASARYYSTLMSDSQALVAEDTLATVSLKGQKRLLDIGGGHGAFARAVRERRSKLEIGVFDLPEVIADAPQSEGIEFIAGSFRADPLPEGFDTMSLVRVLYDHEDATVRDLLSKAFDALPPGGQLLVSEPMSGGQRPERHGDVYFAFYTMAMQTGRARSAERIITLLTEAGFAGITAHRPIRPYVTAVVTAWKPA